MGDNSNTYSNTCQPYKPSNAISGIRPLLRQAPLNIENLPSRVKGSNIKTLPPKMSSDGPMSMNSGGGRGGCNGNRGGGFPFQQNCCMPPTGCFMPPPMCSLYPQPMCTPCPFPPQQMCYPPPCPPAFCCPQAQPMYCPYPNMPPPNCCPPPPCPPPPCCPQPQIEPANSFSNKKDSQCCGAAKTLVCLPKGCQRPGQVTGKGMGSGFGPGGNVGMPSMEQPASYNNCNFYVQELPKGLKANNLIGRSIATSVDPPDENCDMNPNNYGYEIDPYGNHEMKNLPAGDGKVFPPPVNNRTWGNDDEPISGGRFARNNNTTTTDGDTFTGGGRRGNTTNIYIGDEDDDDREMRKGRNAPTRNSNGGATSRGRTRRPPTRKDMNDNRMGNGNRTTATTTTGNRATDGHPTTAGNRTTATTGKRLGNLMGKNRVGKYYEGDKYYDGTVSTRKGYDTDNCRVNTTGGCTAGTFGNNTTREGYNTSGRNETARTFDTGGKGGYETNNKNFQIGVRRNLATSGGYNSDRNDAGRGGYGTDVQNGRNPPVGRGRGYNGLVAPGGRNGTPGPGGRIGTAGRGVRNGSLGPGPRNASPEPGSKKTSPGPGGRMATALPGGRIGMAGPGGRMATAVTGGRNTNGATQTKNHHGCQVRPAEGAKELERRDIGTKSGSRIAKLEDDIDNGADDDGRGPDGRGRRNKGGFSGGAPRENPSAEYCIPQDHNNHECTPITWKRKHPCCMPLKSRKLKTLCQKCHQRYAPTDTGVDEHCGLPMPSPANKSRGGGYSTNGTASSGPRRGPTTPNTGGRITTTAQQTIPPRNKDVQITREVIPPRGGGIGYHVNAPNIDQRFQTTTTGMQTNKVNLRIATEKPHPQRQNFIAQQAITTINPGANQAVNFKLDNLLTGQRNQSPWAPPNRRKTPYQPIRQPRNSDDDSELGSWSDSYSDSRSSSSEGEHHQHPGKKHDHVPVQMHKGNPGKVLQKGRSVTTMMKPGQKINMPKDWNRIRLVNSEGYIPTKDEGVGADCKYNDLTTTPTVQKGRWGPTNGPNGVHRMVPGSVVHLLHPRKIDGSPSHEVSNPLNHHHVNNVSKNKGPQRNFIANVVSVPEFRLPPELFHKYQPFPATRSRSTNHVHDMRKTAIRNMPFGTGNTEIIANYMTVSANADPRLNVQVQLNNPQQNYRVPQPCPVGGNQTCQTSNNQTTYQVPNNHSLQVVTNTTYQHVPVMFQQQALFQNKNQTCSTTSATEILPSHSEIQRIVITKDPNKHIQNVQVVKRHVQHHTIKGHNNHHNNDSCGTNQPVCIPIQPPPICQPISPCPFPQVQCPLPKPRCFVPQPQCPPPKPPCYVPQPQCPPLKPQCYGPQPQCSPPKPRCLVPKPKCRLSIQPQCALNIPPHCPLSIKPQTPCNIEPPCSLAEPHKSTTIEAIVKHDNGGSQIHVGINQTQTSNQELCQSQQPNLSNTQHTVTITTDPNRIDCGSGSGTVGNQQTMTGMSHFSSKMIAPLSSHALYSKLSTSRITSHIPPPTICGPAPKPNVTFNTESRTNFILGSQKVNENGWKHPDSITSTIRGIYGDPIRPPNCYRDPASIPNPNIRSYTISSYEQPNYGIRSEETERTQIPGIGMERNPGVVHRRTPTDPKIPISRGYPPPTRSLPKLNGGLSQTEFQLSQYQNQHALNVNNITQRNFQQKQIPLYRTTTQTKMQIIERPNQPAEVRVVKTPVKELIGYRDNPDRNGGGRDRVRNGGSRGSRNRPGSGPSKNDGQGYNSHGGYYQDSKSITRQGKNSCGVSPCGPNKVACFPLRPCRSPRLITCKGQKPIFSAFPPACPIRETLASILAKKPPANCKWHDKDIPPFYDYCMPSIKYHDPLHQRITYVDHCGQDPQTSNEQDDQEPGPSHRRRSSSSKKKGRGVKRRLNQ